MEKGTDKNSQPMKLTSWRESVELVTKIGVTVIGSAYVVGLIILNMHIRRYGVYYLGFLQIEYIMVGLSWAFLVGSIYCFYFLVLYRIKDIYAESKEGRRRIWHIIWRTLKMLLVLLTLLGSLTYILNVMSDNELVLTKGSSWGALGILFLNALSLTAFGGMVSNVVKNSIMRHVPQDAEVKDEEDAEENVEDLESNDEDVKSGTDIDEKLFTRASYFDVFYKFAAFITALSLYSIYTFPHLSPVFGGGKKQKAEFVVKADQLETVNATGLKLTPDSRIIGPFEVIFESTDFFLITPPEEFKNRKVKAVRIQKELFDAAFYITDRDIIF